MEQGLCYIWYAVRGCWTCSLQAAGAGLRWALAPPSIPHVMVSDTITTLCSAEVCRAFVRQGAAKAGILTISGVASSLALGEHLIGRAASGVPVGCSRWGAATVTSIAVDDLDDGHWP
jgi:hypothetical protein